MQNDQQITFSADCVINLDDLPPLQDYSNLLYTISQQLKTKGLTPPTIKRLLSAEIDQIIKQQNYQTVVAQLLQKLDKYPDISANIIALFFELAQAFMFDPDIKQKLIQIFILSISKNMTPIIHRILITFLKRVSSKIVYIDEQKYQIIMNFIKLSFDHPCPSGNQRDIVYFIDMLLRNKPFRKLLSTYSQSIQSTIDQHLVLNIKCLAYKDAIIDKSIIGEIKNEEFKKAMNELLQ